MELISDFAEKTFPQNLRDNFQRDGFIYFPEFLSNQEVSLAKSKLSSFISSQVPTLPPDLVYYEDRSNPNSLKQIQRILDHSPFFKEMICKGRFEKLASLLLSNDVIPKNLQYFNKPPKIGRATPPHQDGYYFMLEPNEAVTMWLALEDVDEENGCVRYIQGSHKRGMRDHDQTSVLGFSQGITDFGTKDDLNNEVFFPTKAGDLLAHHSLTIHRADANHSLNRNRKALGFIYYSIEAREDKLAHERYAKKLVSRLTSENKI